MTNTGGASLKDLLERQSADSTTSSRMGGKKSKSFTSSGSSSVVLSGSGRNKTPRNKTTKVEIVVGPKNDAVCSSNENSGGNAAPLQDEEIERPSLGRAAALGARPGHFTRTHSSKKMQQPPQSSTQSGRTVTIILPDDDGGEDVDFEGCGRWSASSFSSDISGSPKSRSSGRHSFGSGRNSFTVVENNKAAPMLRRHHSASNSSSNNNRSLELDNSLLEDRLRQVEAELEKTKLDNNRLHMLNSLENNNKAILA